MILGTIMGLVFSTANLGTKMIPVFIAAITAWWKLPFKWIGTKIWYLHNKGKNTNRWSLLYQQLGLMEDESKKRDFSVNEKIDRIIIGQKNTRELADIIYWESDTNGNVEYVSPELCEKLSCPSREFKRKKWYGLICRDDRDRIIKAWEESIKNASLFSEDFRFRSCECDEELKVNARAIHNTDQEGFLINSVVKFKILHDALLPQ